MVCFISSTPQILSSDGRFLSFFFFLFRFIFTIKMILVRLAIDSQEILEDLGPQHFWWVASRCVTILNLIKKLVTRLLGTLLSLLAIISLLLLIRPCLFAALWWTFLSNYLSRVLVIWSYPDRLRSNGWLGLAGFHSVKLLSWSMLI